MSINLNMTENEFWNIIGYTPDKNLSISQNNQHQTERIAAALASENPENIVEFHNILCKKIRDLYIPKIGEIFLLTAYNLKDEINQKFRYISTDGFADFRAWIVGLGKKDFEIFLNFRSETALLDFNLDVNHTNREDLLYLAESLIEEIDMEVDLDYHLDNDHISLLAEMEWEGLDEKYPQLFSTYQGRFK